MSKNTIISSFISNVNTYKNVAEYIEKGKALLELQMNKIIFIDSELENLYNDILIENENTRIIYIDRKELYLYDYIDKITNFNPNTGNKNKDTIEYFMTMCHKTEIIRKAIELDLYDTDNYIWIDFGIQAIFIYDQYFNIGNHHIKDISQSLTNTYDKIRIAHIVDFQQTQFESIDDIIKNIKWYFAGGVFGGNKNMLLLFADLVKQKCIEMIEKYNTLTWEINIWYLVYFENKELFDCYKCNHNISIITNY